MFRPRLPALPSALLILLLSLSVSTAFADEQAATAATNTTATATSPATAAPAAQAEQKPAAKEAPKPQARPPAPAPTKEGEKMQQVEVKGTVEAYDARRHDTASKIIVTQEEIMKYGDSTIGEVLKRLPGISTGGGVRMRGLGAGYTQFLINGEQPPPGFSIANLSPDMIERIEIIRAATAEYSTQAIAGTINIVLKRAVVTASRDLRFGGTSDGRSGGINAGFQIADKDGKLSYSIGGGSYVGRSHNVSNSEEWAYDAAGRTLLLRTTESRPSNETRFLNVAPRINYAFSPDSTLSSQSYLSVNHNISEYESRTKILAGPLPPFIGFTGEFGNDSMAGGSNLNWVLKLPEGRRLDSRIGFSVGRTNSDAATENLDPQERLALSATTDSKSTDKGLTAAGKYSTPLIEGHAFVFGWDGAIGKRDEKNLRRETTYTGLVPDNRNEGFDATVHRLATFAQDEWNITPKWSVYFGLRWEGIETKASATGQAEIKNTSSVWSPIFQTLYRLPNSKADQLRFALTSTYKAPATSSLVPRNFTSRDNSFTSPDYAGNPNLKPELAKGLDLSYEHFFDGGGLFSIATYARRIDDITRQEISLVGDRWVRMMGNGGTADTRGIEMDTKFNLRTFWKGAPNIDLRANATRNWSRLSTVPGPNNRLASQIPFTGNVGFDYKMPGTGPLSIGGNFSFQGAGPVRTSLTEYGWSTPRRGLDGYLLWKFENKNAVRLSLGNVLHQDMISESLYVDEFGSRGRRSLNTANMRVNVFGEIKL